MNYLNSNSPSSRTWWVFYFMYTEEELQDTIEYLEIKVDKYEAVFDSLFSILVDDDAFSQGTKDQLWQVYHDLNRY